MKGFITDHFLLQNRTAQELYHNHAAQLPIIDYHCHLDPKMVAEDYRFRSITELWLGGDHYKWRALRANGISEHLITGNASDWEKFEAWAATIPYCFRNPLYHWTHLELKTAFGIDETLNPESARRIYEHCNDLLQHRHDYTARGLMRRYKVEAVCTTDDPIDDLRYHQAVRESRFEITVLPTWRPDRAMAVESPEAFRTYVQQLSAATGQPIRTLTDFDDALQRRHDYFASMGCKLSDHGLTEFYAEDYTAAEVEAIFAKVLNGSVLTDEEVRQFKSRMLVLFGEMDARSDWAQQFHVGAQRNNNSRMFNQLGADTGYDSIGEGAIAQSCARLLDRLDSEGLLARTILYNLNPSANEVMATMIGNFQDGITAGKIQWGSGWWFLDQKDGMEKQMNALSNLGLLSRFVGMLTDSRSFLSYPRHEYFRRVLCNLIGADIEAGLIPYDGYEQQRVSQMVEDICYYNAKHYFKFN